MRFLGVDLAWWAETRLPRVDFRADMRLGAIRARLWVCLVAVLVSVWMTSAAFAANEFETPSWTELPTPTAHNTTPSCPFPAPAFGPPTPYCKVPTPALPPSDANNPERYLNSAYWPAEKRPDVEVYAIQRYGYHYQGCLELHGPHYCFLADALAAGYPVDQTPRVGDLWLSPSTLYANGFVGPCSTSTYWWIGYVDQVSPNGSFVASGGGSLDASDSGLGVNEYLAAEDACSEFVHLMPPGSPAPKGPQYPINLETGQEIVPQQPVQQHAVKCKVPNVLHRTLRSAYRTFKASRCRIGNVRSLRSKHRGPGRVVKESPRAGTTHPIGSRVTLTLA